METARNSISALPLIHSWGILQTFSSGSQNDAIFSLILRGSEALCKANEDPPRGLGPSFARPAPGLFRGRREGSRLPRLGELPRGGQVQSRSCPRAPGHCPGLSRPPAGAPRPAGTGAAVRAGAPGPTCRGQNRGRARASRPGRPRSCGHRDPRRRRRARTRGLPAPWPGPCKEPATRPWKFFLQ